MAALPNKLGLISESELAVEEERLSKARAAELFSNGILKETEPGSFGALRLIHEFLFSDVYDFAGEVRTENISKGGFRFASALYLDDALSKVEEMPQSTEDEIIEKYVEMNIVHPFREGNGRSMRIWLDDMLKRNIGQAVDWSQVDKEDYFLAMQRSPIKDLEIKALLKSALTDQIDDRAMYMKGIDASYAYEGYEAFKAEDL